MTIKEAIKKILSGKDLAEEEARSVFGQIMAGEATPAQIGALLSGFHIKGETVDEITGAAKTMREKAVSIKAVSGSGTMLDTCGTGGTGKNTFNISTAVAFVAAGCGITVTKHGNRASSGRCGSADVMEALGVNINAPVDVVEKCIEEAGIAFLFAPLFHKAMKHASGPRKELGVRTIFNMLGPLSNPAGATCQVMGVYDGKLTATMAEVLGKLGVNRAFVVHGRDGSDEVSITGVTQVSELKNGNIDTYEVSPADFGIDEAQAEDIAGGDARENARIIRAVLKGEKGAALDIVLMNASMALVAAGYSDNFEDGVRAAEDSITSGSAEKKMEQLIEMTN